jgi:steroid delta-isomerase-like uncharacterized protein
MSEANKAVACRYVEEFWNEGRFDLFEELVAPDAVSHTNLGDMDAAAWKQGVGMMRTAFPDFRIAVEDEMAVDDKVIHRWTLSGTQQGEMFGLPATGNKAAWPVIAIFRLSGDKIAEIWTQGDSLSMMRQLGVTSLPGG